MPQKKHTLLATVYLLATIQFAWCYFWLTRPYVNTALYEQGRERMPFQGRCLMMLPLRWAHGNSLFVSLAHPFSFSKFWFPRPVLPEVLIQGLINVVALLVAGYFTTAIYQGSSRRRLLTPMIYPLLLVVCGATYVMHTVQNFRFVYDLPSLAFFSAAMYLIYFRRHWSLFVGLFLIATINRETTLLLLPLYLINEAADGAEFRWSRMFRTQNIALVLSLAAAWAGWQLLIRHVFAHNVSELYPRLDWNVKSLLVPHAWPQLLSSCGYLLVFVVVMRQCIKDRRLRAWLWLLPIWFVFMFSFGILIETRVFGELIPFVVCATSLITEEIIVSRMKKSRALHGIISQPEPIRVVRAA